MIFLPDQKQAKDSVNYMTSYKIEYGDTQKFTLPPQQIKHFPCQSLGENIGKNVFCAQKSVRIFGNKSGNWIYKRVSVPLNLKPSQIIFKDLSILEVSCAKHN